jgi:hypothetical protein
LSNDELLEILAQTKNVQAVQPHMGKCFDGIRRLDFGDDPKSVDIFAMVSGETRSVDCTTPSAAFLCRCPQHQQYTVPSNSRMSAVPSANGIA